MFAKLAKPLAIFLAVAGFSSFEGYTVFEQHKTRLEAAATRERIDVEIGVMRELVHTVNPKVEHFICPAKDGHPEMDLGVPFTCPNADDGTCFKTPKGETLLASAAGARCQAGKL